MAAKKKPEPADKEQSARFVETARQLEVDESGKAFERAIGIVTPPKNVETEKGPKRLR